VNIGTAGTPNITIGNKTTNTTLSLASGKSWNVDGTTGKGTFASLEVTVGGSLTVGGGTPVTWMAEGDGTCTNGAGTINFPSTPKSSPQVVLTADGGSNLLVQVTGVKGDLSGFTFSCSQLGVTKNKTLNVPSSGLTASSTSVSASGTVTGGGGGSVTVTGSTGTPSIGGSANSAAFDLVTLDSSTASGSVHYIAMTH